MKDLLIRCDKEDPGITLLSVVDKQEHLDIGGLVHEGQAGFKVRK